MPRESHEFEQDFVLVTETEMRVRQATQYTQHHATLLSNPHEEIWEWDPSSLGSEDFVDRHFDEQHTTAWERMLERL
jgi:hypothetical protein